MSENAKTISFVVIGLLAIAIGIFTRPTSAEVDAESLEGEVLTKNFTSADEAKRLRIVRFDEDTATLREFEVAEEDGLWSIPSKSGYPADAARQMAEAATSLMDRKILAVATSSAGDHEEYGVVDPRSPKLEVGQKGVGTRVTMSDVHDEPLADLIIGKAVKDAEGQRYVREAGRDMVYVIEIDPTKLSTNFEDWIEKDLLKLNSWDLQQVQIKDYSAELTPVMTQQGLDFQLSGDIRADMTLAYNDTDAKWSAERLRQFEPAANGYKDFTLAEDEELNTEKLNALKTALDDLQIVDVVRKPQGLSNDLKAGEEFLKNREAMEDLVSKGFVPGRLPGESGEGEEIISSDGEVIATMKNGTEYVLRFGNLTNVGTGGETSDAAADDANGEDSEKDGGVHRYLFVMARFDEAAVKRPELQDLPELPAGAEPAADPSTESNDAADSSNATTEESSSTAPAGEADEATTTDEQQGSAESETDAEPAADEPQDGESAADDANDSNVTADADEAGGTAGDDTDATSNGDSTGTDETNDSGEKDESATDAKQDDVKNIIAERKRIEQENQRKLDDYQALLDKGRENVKDLNLRFGDWYFVVADDVFKKIRLGRADVIKKKEKKEEDAADTATGSQDEPVDITTPGIVPGLPQIPGVSD